MRGAGEGGETGGEGGKGGLKEGRNERYIGSKSGYNRRSKEGHQGTRRAIMVTTSYAVGGGGGVRRGKNGWVRR